MSVLWKNRHVSCNNTKLKMDEACVHVMSSFSEELKLWKQVEECHKCKYLPWSTLPPHRNIPLVVETKYPVKFIYSNQQGQYYCGVKYRFDEYGIYGWNITEEDCNSVTVTEKPPIPFLPIIGAFLIFLGISLIWNLGKCVMNSEWITRLRERNMPFSELESDLGSPSSAEGPPISRDIMPAVRRQRTRILSLDVFRGICVAIMIFVNYGGGQYWFFKHSAWNGLTIADLVFPWFLWIMGVSLVISLRSQLRSSVRRRQVLAKVLTRSVILFALGLLLNTLSACERTDLQMLRIPGVLQRIGLAYLIVGSLEALTLKPQGSFQYGHWVTLQLQDVLDAWLQWIVVIALAVIHVLVSLLMPVPGCPTGYLGPGGLDSSFQDGDIYLNCTGGAAGYIDRLILGSDHIYQIPTCYKVYDTVLPYDPEGILGTLTAVLNVYLGVQAGRILLSYHYTVSRVLRWCVWGFLCGVGAAVLCRFQKDDGWIPVNKNLWSVSFVLLTACFAFLFLSMLYLVADAGKWWKGYPFLYAGMNPIILYVGHEIAHNKFPWSWQPYYHTHAEWLAMDVWGTCLWLLIAFILFKKDIFISI